MASVVGNQLHLTAPLVNAYAATVTQVVSVPEYTSLTVMPGASVVPGVWNGSRGGIVAFLATGTVTVQGSINASGAGFRGGVFVNNANGPMGCISLDGQAPPGSGERNAQKGEGVGGYANDIVGYGNRANGGGGANCHNAGGGGGGHGGRGGNGGATLTSDGSRDVGGIGGARVLYSPLERLLFGGGGGAGEGNVSEGTSGGRGGGVVFVRGQSLAGSGVISANGQSAANAGDDGAGGGGAGGAISLRFVGSAACGSVQANGGTGGNSQAQSSPSVVERGPGGGGGGGRVLLQADSVSCPVQLGNGVGGQTSLGNARGAGPSSPADPNSQGEQPSVPGGFSTPAAPVITQPAHGASTNDQTPTVSGTTASGATVRVFIDGALSGTTLADGVGSFAFTVPVSLAVGAHTVSAEATKDGATGPRSAANDFTIDLTPPAAPTLTSPAEGALLNDDTPTFLGTAENGTTVTLLVGGVPVGAGWTSGGLWSVTPATSLGQGPQVAAARATDGAGNQSALSSEVAFTIDSVPPAAPSLTQPSGPISDVAPTVVGTAEDGADVAILLDGNGVGSVTATGGAFSFPLAGLTQGPHTVEAIAIDAAGNSSPASIPLSFTVDTVSPPTPVLSAPAADAFLSDATPDFSGTAEADSLVRVYINGALAGEVTAAGGSWLFTAPMTLAEGTHVVEVKAIDAAGNHSGFSSPRSFTIDVTPPATPLITHPLDGSYTADDTPTFEGSAEVGVTLTVRVDGVDVGSGVVGPSGLWQLTSGVVLSSTAHAAEAVAIDAAGNASSSPLVSFTVDTTLVDTAIDAGPSGLVSSASASFTFSANKGGVTYECSLDGAAFAACVNPLSLSGLSEGAHVLWVRAVDMLGPDATPAVRAWTVDTVAPNAPVFLRPVPNDVVGTATPVLEGTAEPGASVSVALDGQPLGSATADAAGRWSLAVASPLAAGAHAVAATATDAAGNASAPSGGVDFTVDLAALDTFITSAPAPLTNVSSASLTLASSRPGASFECSLNGAAFTPCSSPVSFSGLQDGPFELRARARDGAELDATPARAQWQVDTVAPAAPAFAAPQPSEQIATGTPTFRGTAEPGSAVTVWVDGVSAGNATADASGVFTLTLSAPLSLGAHSVWASATDGAGNAGPASAPIAFTVDPNALDTLVVSGPAPLVAQSSATFTLAASQPGATFECALDGAAFDACATPLVLSLLGDGAHALDVRAVVGASVDPTPARWEWRVDTTAPAAPVLSSPAADALLADKTPSVSGTAEPGSWVELLVDAAVSGGARADAAGQWTLGLATPLSDGAHALSARATDAAGNQGPASPARAVRIDTTPPVAPTLSFPTAGLILGETAPTLEGQSELGTVVTVVLDGATLGNVPTNGAGQWRIAVLTPLAVGAHQVTARATDAAGNVGPFSAPTPFQVDPGALAAPSILSPAHGSVSSTGAVVVTGSAVPSSLIALSVNGQVALAAAADASGVWSASFAQPLADGVHLLRATARLGNAMSPASAAVQLVVDTAAPETTIASGPDPVTQQPEARFAFVASEPATFECALDGAPFGDCATPYQLTALEAGEHRLEVRARDAAGNVDPTPAVHVWSVRGEPGFSVRGYHGGGCGCGAGGGVELYGALLLLVGLCRSRRRLGAPLPAPKRDR